MKFRHTIHGLSTVSFTSTPQKNPTNGELTGVILDNWEEIQHSAAMGLEELQSRVGKLEEVLARLYKETDVLTLLDKAVKMQDKIEKPPREPAPPGKSLAQVLEKKTGGRPKKTEVKP